MLLIVHSQNARIWEYAIGKQGFVSAEMGLPDLRVISVSSLVNLLNYYLLYLLVSGLSDGKQSRSDLYIF